MSHPGVYANPVVQEVIELYRDLFTEDFRRLPIRQQLDLQARHVTEAHQAGNTAVVPLFKCWHPLWVGQSADQIMAYALTLEDSRETVAREYGFSNWRDVEAQGVMAPDATFELAVDWLLAGNTVGLRELLQQHAELPRGRSWWGHRSTLLHYAGCNGVETHRQVVPYNLAEMAQLLIDSGADVNATAGMYGGDCTPLALLTTSNFPVEAGIADAVTRILIAAGAQTNASP